MEAASSHIVRTKRAKSNASGGQIVIPAASASAPRRRRAKKNKIVRPLRPLWPDRSWGRQRARSKLSLPRSYPCPFHQPDDNNNWYGHTHGSCDDSDLICRPRRRDWANLADGPAGLIADRVLAHDVADYVRFRAVCRPWRQSSTDPRLHSGLDRLFHPWRWTMLRDDGAEPPGHRRFLNTSSGECIKVHIPELSHYLLLAVTPQGLLVLVRKTHRATVRLLNPLTRQLTHLPPLTTLLPPKNHNKLTGRNSQFDIEFTAWGSGVANDDSTVVLCFSMLRMIGVAKPGDHRWTLLRYHCGTAATPLMFAGRFYCFSVDGLMVLETGADHPPRLELAADMADMQVSSFGHSMHLVNNCGELMLVHSRCTRLAAQPHKFVRCYDAYGVDFDTRTLFPVKSFGGRAVFLGMYCSLSLPLDIFPSRSIISADTIYLSSAVSLEAAAYHLADGSSEGTTRHKDSLLPRPHTLVDCLTLSVTP